MPRRDALPTYRKHRASGQAVVTLSGADHYLGPHGSKASKAEYDRLITEWLANGRQLIGGSQASLSLAELIAAYRDFVLTYYVKNGRPTSEQHDIASALRLVRQDYGQFEVLQFGPLVFKAVRLKMIETGWARTTINKQVQPICRMFRWAVENEICPPSVYQALKAVSGLCKGKSEARETKPIEPVADIVVNATLPYLTPVAADMIRFQRLTGCRPVEVCLLLPADVDCSGEVWKYIPSEHKTEHRGKQRVIFIGPEAQKILSRYLSSDSREFCFSPSDSEKDRRGRMHAARKTPLNCGNRPGTNRSSKPKRSAGEKYTSTSYRRAIARAVAKANSERKKNAKNGEDVVLLEKWAPNRLRHATATRIRARFGLEAAQVTLGHSQADATQIYAERDMVKAEAVMREVG
jgi:integrase